MSRIAVTCEACGHSVEKERGAVHRAREAGYGLYCGRACFGLTRRSGKARAETKAEKAAYDREYRAKYRARLQAEKAAYFQRTYDPAQAAEQRRANMPRHVAYCRRPEYRAKKHDYDVTRSAAKYGEFAEAQQILLELQRTVRRIEPDKYERAKARGYYLRTSTRKVPDHGTA